MDFHYNSPTILTSANHLRATITEVLVKSNEKPHGLKKKLTPLSRIIIHNCLPLFPCPDDHKIPDNHRIAPQTPQTPPTSIEFPCEGKYGNIETDENIPK